MIVSHDRHLLEATVDRLWLVRDGTVKPFDGDLDDYRKIVLSGPAPAGDKPEKPAAKAPAAARGETKALAKRVAEVEATMEKLRADIDKIDRSSPSPAISRPIPTAPPRPRRPAGFAKSNSPRPRRPGWRPAPRWRRRGAELVLLDRLAPPGPEHARTLGVALLQEGRRGDAVGAEGAEVAAQLAPGDEVADAVEIADRHRPGDALGRPALLVIVAERDLLALVDPAANLGEVDAVLGRLPGRPVRETGSSATSRSFSGTMAASLAMRSAAARDKAGSPRDCTQRAPRAAASSSSDVSMRGGRSKPPSRM